MPALRVRKGLEEGRLKLGRMVGRVLVSPRGREFGISIGRIRGERDLTGRLLQHLQYLAKTAKEKVRNYSVRRQFPIRRRRVIPAVG
jgi:predicted transposase YdaD